MGKQMGRIIIAVFLILVGGVALMSNLNMLPFEIDNNQTFWLAAFGVGGLAFIAVFLSDMKGSWWAAIPGFTLLGLGLLIGFERFWNELGGAVFLGSIAVAFWAVLATAPKERWWALIPAGVMSTLALVVVASGGDAQGYLTGGLFFIGMALTFLLVYFIMHMTWALWPAGILALLGALIMAGAGGAAALVWPVILILGGGWLIYRSMRPRLG